MSKKAVVLLSGGIDSSTVFASVRDRGYKAYALSFDYSQRHLIELVSARKVAAVLGTEKHLVINFNMGEIGGSALTTGIEVPKDRSRKSEAVKEPGKIGSSEAKKILTSKPLNLSNSVCSPNSELIPVTYVPARNTIFLSFALAWAEVLNTADIFIGANAIDYSGYPDCRPEYLKAFEHMANLATKASVERKIRFKINAPLINLTKAEIIKKGTRLGLDYRLTWSCYDPQPLKVQKSEVRSQKLEKKKKDIRSSQLPSFPSYKPCGRCDSCLFRAKGFKEAGLKDPLLLSYLP